MVNESVVSPNTEKWNMERDFTHTEMLKIRKIQKKVYKNSLISIVQIKM